MRRPALGNPAARFGMMNRPTLQRWQHPLAELVVTPERAAWILERYPPSDQGRPGILHTETQRGPKPRRDAPRPLPLNEPCPVNEFPDWRRTHEFPGNEDALIEENAPGEADVESEEQEELAA
jgi:hypothetical protein